MNDLYIIRGFLEANSAGSFLVKLNQQSTMMHQNSSPYGHYGAQNGNHVGQTKNTIEEAHAEEKKSLDSLSRFISKISIYLIIISINKFQFCIQFYYSRL